LLNRSKETDISGELQSSNIRIIDYAEIPLRPYKPRKILDLILALISGTIVGSGLVFFIEYLIQLSRSKNASVLFRIILPWYYPKIQPGNNKSPAISKDSQLNSANEITEAFRILRTNLQFF